MNQIFRTSICHSLLNEAEAALEKLTESLLALENGGQEADLRKALGIAHQIKGSAATVGFNRAARLAHLMEDLIQRVLDTGGQLSSQATDAMLHSTDGLKQYVDCLRKGKSQTYCFEDYVQPLLAIQPGNASRGNETIQKTPARPTAGAAESHATAAHADAEAKSGFSSELRRALRLPLPPGFHLLLEK